MSRWKGETLCGNTDESGIIEDGPDRRGVRRVMEMACRAKPGVFEYKEIRDGKLDSRNNYLLILFNLHGEGISL
jgi:hypothetical protein